MSLHRFHDDELATAPWKNGGGVTREIVRRPAGASLEAFDWRVSLATMAVDGPFSPFPGVDRTLVLLDGAGVHLRSPDGTIDRRIDRLDSIAFPGEIPLSCRLIAGACTDFNVMVRRDRLHASLEIVGTAGVLSASPCGLLFSARGSWRVRRSAGSSDPAAEDIHLADGAGIWWEDESHGWRISPSTPSAAMLAVRVR